MMARILDALPEKRHAVASKYPLDEWFDGRVWELTRGEDFTVSVTGVRSQLSAAASVQKLKLATRKTSETTLAIQATPVSTNGQVP